MSASSSRNLLTSFLTVLIVLIFTFFALEIFLRITHVYGARISWSVPDPVLGWRFAPNGRFWAHEENDHPIRWTTNSHGWKDRDWGPKTPGKMRVAVLGDSYAEAMQVEPDKNAIALAAGLTGAEWMNFGRAGFTQTEELLVLEKEVLAFDPDLIVLYFFPINDIEDIAPETTTDPVRPYFKVSETGSLQLDTSFNQTRAYKLKSLASRLKRHSALISLMTQRFSLLQRRSLVEQLRSQSQEGPSPLKNYLSLATSRPDPVFARNYDLNKKLIESMAALARNHGKDFLLVLLDLPIYRPEIELDYKLKDPTFDPLFFEKDLAALSGKLGIRFLNLQKSFRESYTLLGEMLHWNYWGQQIKADSWEYGAHTGHWNYQGHQTAAQGLAEAFKAWQAERAAAVSSSPESPSQSLNSAR